MAVEINSFVDFVFITAFPRIANLTKEAKMHLENMSYWPKLETPLAGLQPDDSRR